MKYKSLINKNQENLLKHQEKAFKGIVKSVRANGWNVDNESICHDRNWGWVILADKRTEDCGVVLRRIKPVQVGSENDVERLRALQIKLRRELVEIFPYILRSNRNRNTKAEFLKPLFSLS